jgi:Holliday junction resolvase
MNINFGLKLTLAFAQELAGRVLAEFGPTVTLVVWDERYTSKEAAARAHSRDPNRYLYGTLDAEAACIILEHYYIDNGVGALPINVADDAVRVACLDMYETRQRKEHLKKMEMLAERERKLQRRKDAIAQALEIEQAGSIEKSGGQAKTKKRRKKKR